MDRNANLKASIGQFLTALFDLMLLQILWIVCTLPVITVGPSTSALYAVMLKVASGEQTHTFSDYFHAFKINFKQAIVIGLIALFGAVVIYCDFRYGIAVEGTFRTVFFIVAGAASVIWLIFTFNTFPLQSRFENTLKGHIKNAFAMALCNPGRTILTWVIYSIPILMLLFLPTEVSAYIGWVYLLFGVSLPVYVNCKTLLKMFERMEGMEAKKEKEEKDEGEPEE